jgi:hypothetical protein
VRDARADGTACWSSQATALRSVRGGAATLVRVPIVIAASPVTAANGADDGSTISTTKTIEQSLDHHDRSERRDT